jgi:energy-coupling factor transporter transmembrane protein EcfT
VSLTNTLNAVTSNQASRLSAFRDRLPGSIVLLLFTCAMVSVLLIGQEQGRADARDTVGTLLLILIVCFVVWVTLDLNLPESGLIRVSQEPIIRLLKAMN